MLIIAVELLASVEGMDLMIPNRRVLVSVHSDDEKQEAEGQQVSNTAEGGDHRHPEKIRSPASSQTDRDGRAAAQEQLPSVRRRDTVRMRGYSTREDAKEGS